MFPFPVRLIVLRRQLADASAGTLTSMTSLPSRINCCESRFTHTAFGETWGFMVMISVWAPRNIMELALWLEGWLAMHAK